MATKLVHGPWLHNDHSEDPTWSDRAGMDWCWAKPPGAVGGFFDIDKDVTEIRFVLSNQSDPNSYEVKTNNFALLLTREGKSYGWDQVGTYLGEFINDHPKLTHLSLEVR